ncbi:transporter substrate-binding domain-containing protein [Parabacteroides sp. OttesenSCG-928-N08]|nr:transporter substrate-binding domain-containing protein [Parabacteroides sp. OttesenSCG-928-N08]
MRTKRLLVLYLVLFVIVVLTMIGLLKITGNSALITHRDYPEIAAEGKLRLATDYNRSGYYISGDTIEGFQYELARAIAELSGLEVEIVLEMSLADSYEMLNGMTCDVIARNIPITADSKELFLFTAPVILNKQVLVQRSEENNNGMAPIRNQLELAHKTLYVPKDSPAILRLRNLEKEIGDSIFVVQDELYADEQLIIMVAKGDIDFAVCDQSIAAKSQESYPEIDIKTDISFTQLQSWAIRKESPILLDSLNRWLDEIRQSGLYDRIYRRYYK